MFQHFMLNHPLQPRLRTLQFNKSQSSKLSNLAKSALSLAGQEHGPYINADWATVLKVLEFRKERIR